MIKNILLAFVFLPLMVISQDQEIATFVSYNVLNYRNETTYCTNNNNSPIAKEGYMKTIFSHIQPDLIACNEVGANPTNAVKILERCLNVNGETKFQMASFSSSSGSDLANAFFYNGEMFTMYSNDKILNEVGGAAIVRLIDVFTLYYNDANLSLGSDTTFLTVFVAHLKAGNTSSNRGKRASATQAVMNYISTQSLTGNYIFSGDFNVYDASETAFQNLVAPNDGSIKFNDPVNRMGDWNNNSSYADVHTQSTHYSSNGCASGGGLDDRFDFVLISNDMTSDGDHMEYVNNSYKAVANDGNHFNQSINSGTNNSVPSSVLDAIYNGSDHLPVVMDIIITEAMPNSVAEFDPASFDVSFVNPSYGALKGVIRGSGSEFQIHLYSVTGSLLASEKIKVSGSGKFTIPVNATGIVLVEITNESGYKKIVKVIQN